MGTRTGFKTLAKHLIAAFLSAVMVTVAAGAMFALSSALDRTGDEWDSIMRNWIENAGEP